MFANSRAPKRIYQVKMLSKLLIILLSVTGNMSTDSCNMNGTLHQALHYEGFHRNMTYNLTFQEPFQSECYVLIEQGLPAGVYVDPDELKELKRMNKLVAIPMHTVKTELPAELSSPITVFIFAKVTGKEVRLALPVHARFHYPVKYGGDFQNKIDQPLVYIRCEKKLDCKSAQRPLLFYCTGAKLNVCTWDGIAASRGSDSPIIFSVPIGDISHLHVVAPVTIGVVVLLSIYLFKTLHDYKMAAMAAMQKTPEEKLP